MIGARPGIEGTDDRKPKGFMLDPIRRNRAVSVKRRTMRLVLTADGLSGATAPTTFDRPPDVCTPRGVMPTTVKDS